ncbi:MAG: hypothetical protein ACK4VO_04910 [Pseudobdellovibrio sp.]
MKNSIIQLFEQRFEKKLETSLEKITTHPLFLKTVSEAINLNSKRMLLSQKAMQFLIQKAELPLKKDQDKMLFLLQEMQFHIQRLESEIKSINNEKKSDRKVESINTSKVHDINSKKDDQPQPLKKKESLRDRIQLDSLN